MSSRYYMADRYPRINDETAREYEDRLMRLARSHRFTEVCGVNLHGDCRSADSCGCKCHEPHPDSDLVQDIIKLLCEVDSEGRSSEHDLTGTARDIIERVRREL
ncbi:hypothetical protein SEA_SICARIUS2_46 [Arthrobacter phage Sicarius2]|uniref:Uncharacterized protein n=1 Tax=Arthrobacter phage Sicarius2 TaxID=2836090 RepID=A0A8F3IKD6_9CAUD|nr:hypothetical protein SEA_SICARIUS2_46 [Arthrobacter phage Sicarius2]